MAVRTIEYGIPELSHGLSQRLSWVVPGILGSLTREMKVHLAATGRYLHLDT